ACRTCSTRATPRCAASRRWASRASSGCGRRSKESMATIEGVEIEVSAEAVVVTAAAPLTVLSSAVAGGGLGRARTLVNLHVDKDCPWEGAEVRLAAFVARRCLPAPWIGLLTAAWTERARVAADSAGGVGALVVATVGLSNPVAAGWSPPARVEPGTIN